jgi:hypothetical protein
MHKKQKIQSMPNKARPFYVRYGGSLDAIDESHVWRKLKREDGKSQGRGVYGQIKSMPSWDARKRYDVDWWHLPFATTASNCKCGFDYEEQTETETETVTATAEV